MTEPKTYLTVPYAQKDAAKALGARWDAANKKWYVPTGKDIELFAQWQIDNTVLAKTTATADKSISGMKINTSNHKTSGTFTYPSIKDFTAYDGDLAPWD